MPRGPADAIGLRLSGDPGGIGSIEVNRGGGEEEGPRKNPGVFFKMFLNRFGVLGLVPSSRA